MQTTRRLLHDSTSFSLFTPLGIGICSRRIDNHRPPPVLICAAQSLLERYRWKEQTSIVRPTWSKVIGTVVIDQATVPSCMISLGDDININAQ
jgi:hypothetical protein